MPIEPGRTSVRRPTAPPRRPRPALPPEPAERSEPEPGPTPEPEPEPERAAGHPGPADEATGPAPG